MGNFFAAILIKSAYSYSGIRYFSNKQQAQGKVFLYYKMCQFVFKSAGNNDHKLECGL